MLKVSFKTITSVKNSRITKERLQRKDYKNARIAKEGLQRRNDNEGKINDGLLKLANIWTIIKSLLGVDAAT